jgi:hypothetical protein
MAYEELGASDLMGEYEIGEDEFGRQVRVRRRRPMQQRPQVAANRIEPLPVNWLTAVAANVTMTATATPQRKFKPLRLVINDNPAQGVTFVEVLTAAGYTIQDIKIGANSQLNNDGSLPGALFLPTSVGTSFSFETAHVGNTVKIFAAHGGAQPHTFVAAFIGKSYFTSQI